MGARRRYPQFEHLTAEELKNMLRISKLSAKEKQIAVQCILWTDMTLVDIGIAHKMDRRTVVRHMEDFILPELERIMHRQSKAGA